MPHDFDREQTALKLQSGQKTYLDYSLMPCNQDEEDLLGDGVQCITEAEEVMDYFGMRAEKNEYEGEDGTVQTDRWETQRVISFHWSEKFVKQDLEELKISATT